MNLNFWCILPLTSIRRLNDPHKPPISNVSNQKIPTMSRGWWANGAWVRRDLRGDLAAYAHEEGRFAAETDADSGSLGGGFCRVVIGLDVEP